MTGLKVSKVVYGVVCQYGRYMNTVSMRLSAHIIYKYQQPIPKPDLITLCDCVKPVIDDIKLIIDYVVKYNEIPGSLEFNYTEICGTPLS